MHTIINGFTRNNMADKLAQRIGKPIYHKNPASSGKEKYRQKISEQWTPQPQCLNDQLNRKTKKIISKHQPTSHAFFSIGKNYDGDVLFKNVEKKNERDFQLIFDEKKLDNRNCATWEEDLDEEFSFLEGLRDRGVVERHENRVFSNAQPQPNKIKQKRNFSQRQFSRRREVELQSVNKERFEFDDNNSFLQNDNRLNKRLRLQKNVRHLQTSDENDFKHIIIQHKGNTHQPYPIIYNIKCKNVIISKKFD